MALCHRNTGFELTGFMALLSKNNQLVHMGTYPVVANNDKIGYNIPSLTVGK